MDHLRSHAVPYNAIHWLSQFDQRSACFSSENRASSVTAKLFPYSGRHLERKSEGKTAKTEISWEVSENFNGNFQRKLSTATFKGNFSTATSSGTLEQNCSMASICFEKFSLKTLFSLNGCFVNSYGEKWLSYWLLLTSRLATLLTIRPLVYLESGFIDCLIAWHATATDRWRLGQWNSPKDLFNVFNVFNEYCSIEFFSLK